MKPHRRRQQGRKVDTAYSPSKLARWGAHPHNIYKQKNFSQSPIPPGYKLSEKHTKIPIEHESYKPMQDKIQRGKMREINNTEPGRRRDYLIEEYEAWMANGRPTYGSPGKHADKNEWHKTQGKASGIWQDEVEDQDPKRTRRVDLRDVYSDMIERGD